MQCKMKFYKYTTVEKFPFKRKINTLTKKTKKELNVSNLTVKTFIMLQNSYI